jgi:hypothetical protein
MAAIRTSNSLPTGVSICRLRTAGVAGDITTVRELISSPFIQFFD